MVQLKYFGDGRDFFKYDLITSIFEHSALRHYVFVPMLTEHRHDGEGNTRPHNRGDKSDELREFMRRCQCKSLKHWATWLSRYVESYATIEPVDETFFSDQTRDEYWMRFRPIIGQTEALVFVDPDTGLETGKPSYLRDAGREKYILNYELRSLIGEVDPSSVLMIYQHLTRDRRKHATSVDKKLEQVQRADRTALACAYREGDLAFLFVSKTRELHDVIKGIIEGYYAISNHTCKSLHAEGIVTANDPRAGIHRRRTFGSRELF
jgi:hypothetical protein